MALEEYLDDDIEMLQDKLRLYLNTLAAVHKM
jgi:hypothetical protein